MSTAPLAVTDPVGSATAGPLLRIEDLAVRFGTIQAVDGVDLTVGEGELVALAGENGAGKSTLVRCIAGDVAPTRGRIVLDGVEVPARGRERARRGVAVVWQDLALCANLDVASNLMLGREPGRLVRSTTRLHVAARQLLDDLHIPLGDTTQSVASLSGGQRQLLAVARAIRDAPRLLILDEPTASLGVAETAQVEELVNAMRAAGTTVVLVSHDVEQMYRLADRIVVLRRGRVVATADPATTHPDEVIAAMAGQELDSSARRQLDRLHGLVGRLASADPSSGVPLILSALGTALGSDRLTLHTVDGPLLRVTASLGLPAELEAAWDALPVGAPGGAIGLAAERGQPVIGTDPATAAPPAHHGSLPGQPATGSVWAVPVPGPAGTAPTGVVTVHVRASRPPARAELDLVAVYVGHLASALERERLLGEVTARNRVLETIREVLQTLTGPGALDPALTAALAVLRTGLQADEVGLAGALPDPASPVAPWRAVSGTGASPSAALTAAAGAALAGRVPAGDSTLTASFPAPGGPAALVARWDGAAPDDALAMLEDAANSLGLALEREEAQRAVQEAAAARRSQDLQRQFLSRLSHELRTPLTAIRGYASSLLAADVSWDPASQSRFLERIAAESARLGRLVDDLLDFSAIESQVLRLHPDWCDLPLVLDAAVACLEPEAAAVVELRRAPDLPPVWADHDRLEQVLVNLLDNAVRHNPPGTRVQVRATASGTEVTLLVSDDGVGLPPGLLGEAGAPRPRRSPTAGAGLGLSIARGIVAAHGGHLSADSSERGTTFRIDLPSEQPDDHAGDPFGAGLAGSQV